MRFDHARPAADDPLLRYSVAEFAEILFEVFAAADVRSIVEIGSEAGGFTGQLLDYATRRGGHLVAVDPAPSEHVRTLAAAGEAFSLVEATSHRALDELEAADAYIIDGDHNYFTVTGELERIAAAATRVAGAPLVVVQDVGWPCGRRDLYYDPEGLPAEARQPYVYGGVLPWDSRPGAGGLRGEGHFAVAVDEGGPRNGVCTALEDFLGGHPELEVLSLPCIFGLAVVFASGAPWAPEVRRLLAPFDDHPLLARLEANRVRLYLEVIALQDLIARERRAQAERVAGLHARVDALAAEVRLLREARRVEEAGQIPG